MMSFAEKYSFHLSLLMDWLSMIPGSLLIPEKYQGKHCFSELLPPTPLVEVEVTI